MSIIIRQLKFTSVLLTVFTNNIITLRNNRKYQKMMAKWSSLSDWTECNCLYLDTAHFVSSSRIFPVDGKGAQSVDGEQMDQNNTSGFKDLDGAVATTPKVEPWFRRAEVDLDG